MVRDFRERIREYLGARRISARELSLAAELNPDEVARILENPRRVPRITTLFQLCKVTGWRVEDAVYWALGEEPPPVAQGEPEQIIVGQLARMGFSENRRDIILAWLLEMRPAAREGEQAGPGHSRSASHDSADSSSA